MITTHKFAPDGTPTYTVFFSSKTRTESIIGSLAILASGADVDRLDYEANRSFFHILGVNTRSLPQFYGPDRERIGGLHEIQEHLSEITGFDELLELIFYLAAIYSPPRESAG